MCLLHRWQIQVVVESDAEGLVGLGGLIMVLITLLLRLFQVELYQIRDYHYSAEYE